MYVLQRWLILCLAVSLTGARLDVTFFSQTATPSLTGNLFISGFSGGDSISTVGTGFSYGRILDTGTGSELPAGSFQTDNFGYSRRLHLPTGASRPGVYYCDANANTGETERLQTVWVAEEAEIKPGMQTKTVSWGDDVILTMATILSEASLKWRHNGMQKSEWNGESSITISFAKTSDAGIYECYSSETQRSRGKHGFMRLIVRGCPNGKWSLPECLFSCPTCFNGGICNSDTGECICPPGFQGSNCETGCGKNRWGMTCDRRCSSGNSDACRRTMYCIADPYGCSCSASYGGIDCSTDCQTGMYGSGCTLTCHCINGCNRATGECSSGGCEQGWSGSKCHIPDSCDDGFYGELCEYKCHCQDNAACDKTTGVCSNGQCAPGWMDVNITDCQQDGSPTIRSLYNIKVNPGEQTSIICTIIGNPTALPDDVTLVDQSGSPVTRTSHSYTEKYLSMTNFGSLIVDNGRSYTCRVGSRSKDLTAFNVYALPTFSPSNIPQITLQATQVIVTWEKWVAGDDLGEGPAEAYKVYFKKTTDVDWTQHQNFQVVDQDQTTYTTDITGLDWSTSYDFTVTVKRPGLRGEGSMETVTTAITLCDVPSEGPTIAGATSSNPNELLITLEVPDSSKVKCDDGYIRNFHFKHRQANAKDEYLEESANDGNARTFSLTGFLAYTEYELMASFNNRDEQSPWSSMHKARTAEDLPTKPRNVALKPAVFVIEVLWSIPYPTNGIIRKYTIMYWETSKKATTTEVKELKENLQDLNTYLITNLTYKVSYSVQVAAYTSRGQGALSEAISAETTEAIPATPTNVQVLDIKDKEIELTWTEPFPFSGHIEQYGISYSSVESVFKGMQRQFNSFLVRGGISTFTIEDLSPGTIYEININASTVKGFGEATTLSTGTSFTVDISTTLSMTEDIKNDINHYGTLTQVSLPPLSEDFGISPETSLLSYVVVLEYDQSPNTRRKRDIDISKLGEFNETGPPYYITALLPLHDLPKKFIFGDGGIHGGFTNVPLTIGRQYGVYYGLKSDVTGEPLYHFDDHPSIRFTASFQESTSQCSSTTTIIVTVIALILIFCLVIVLVFIVRRQNQMKSPLKHKEVQFRSSGRKPGEKKMSRLELKEKQDKSQEGFHDDDHQYAYVNVSTQQSADLTSARKPQKGQQDNGDRLYTGLQKELKSESEYTTLNLS